MDTSDAEKGGQVRARGGAISRHVLLVHNRNLYRLFFFFCFLNNKRILMPDIDYTFYVQTKGKL